MAHCAHALSGRMRPPLFYPASKPFQKNDAAPQMPGLSIATEHGKDAEFVIAIDVLEACTFQGTQLCRQCIGAVVGIACVFIRDLEEFFFFRIVGVCINPVDPHPKVPVFQFPRR